MRRPPSPVDADEDAGAGDLGGIVADRPILEGSKGRLDFAETLVDLVGQFVGLLVFGLEGFLFGLKRLDGRLLFLGEGDGVAGQPTQAGGVAKGEVDSDLDPLPALGGKVSASAFSFSATSRSSSAGSSSQPPSSCWKRSRMIVPPAAS